MLRADCPRLSLCVFSRVSLPATVGRHNVCRRDSLTPMRVRGHHSGVHNWEKKTDKKKKRRNTITHLTNTNVTGLPTLPNFPFRCLLFLLCCFIFVCSRCGPSHLPPTGCWSWWTYQGVWWIAEPWCEAIQARCWIGLRRTGGSQVARGDQGP